MIARMVRIFIRFVLGVVIFLIVALLVGDRFVQFRMDDKELTEWFKARHVVPHIGYYEALGRKVRYIGVGDNPEATLLFIHGAPSSMSYWKAYLADSVLLSRATMYAVDRPGYGYSGLADPLPDISAQAAIISKILQSASGESANYRRWRELWIADRCPADDGLSGTGRWADPDGAAARSWAGGILLVHASYREPARPLDRPADVADSEPGKD